MSNLITTTSFKNSSTQTLTSLIKIGQYDTDTYTALMEIDLPRIKTRVSENDYQLYNFYLRLKYNAYPNGVSSVISILEGIFNDY